MRSFGRLGASVALIVGLSAGSTAGAASSEEPIYDHLVDTLKRDWLSVGLLIQIVGDLQDQDAGPGEPGFSVANARLSLSGELDRGFGYFFQGSFANSPSLLDGKLLYRLNPSLTVDAGLFKAPFSGEFLTSAAGIDFVNRSRTVSALAPGREVGMQLRVRTAESGLGFSVGMFNGNRFDENNNGNDNGRFLYVARGELRPAGLRDADLRGLLTVGVNVATSRDDGSSLVGGQLVNFSGTRDLAGVDVRYTRDRLLLSGEAIWADLDAESGPDVQPNGGHVTVGYMLAEKQQLLLRRDRLSGDGLFDKPDQWILGYNFWPTRVSEFQVNYIAPERGGFDTHQVLLNAQLGF